MLARNGTCWVWDVLAFSLLHLSFFGTIASVVLSSGILGRCLHNRRKLPFPISVGRLSLANLQGACAMETNTVALIRTRQIQAIMTLPETLSFSAQLMRCNVTYIMGTCWVWDVLTFSFLHLSFIWTIASVVLSSGILGRCLRNHRKTLVSSVYLCLFPREGFPRQTYIKQVG